MHISKSDTLLKNISVPVTVTILATENEFYRGIKKFQGCVSLAIATTISFGVKSPDLFPIDMLSSRNVLWCLVQPACGKK